MRDRSRRDPRQHGPETARSTVLRFRRRMRNLGTETPNHQRTGRELPAGRRSLPTLSAPAQLLLLLSDDIFLAGYTLNPLAGCNIRLRAYSVTRGAKIILMNQHW